MSPTRRLRKQLSRIDYLAIRGSERPQSSFLPNGRRLRGVLVVPGVVLARDRHFYALGNAAYSAQLSLSQVLQVATLEQIESVLRSVRRRARMYRIRRRRAGASS